MKIGSTLSVNKIAVSSFIQQNTMSTSRNDSVSKGFSNELITICIHEDYILAEGADKTRELK